MSPERDRDTPSQLEQDAIDVLLWLRPNVGRALSYADISGAPASPTAACGVRCQKPGPPPTNSDTGWSSSWPSATRSSAERG